MAPTIQRFNQTNRVAALIDAATISIDCNVVEIGILTSLSQSSQFANPTGSPTEGQLLQIRLSSTVSRTISFDTAYQTASSLSLPFATTGNDFEDYIAFRYNSIDSKWDLIGTTIGASITNTWRSFTQNISTKPISSGRFNVTTTGLTTAKAIIVMQATGSNLNIDDIEWDGIVANGIATSSTQFTCYWNASAPVSGSKNFNYLQV